eukprot:1145401-Pelagomonas_calceolata.AAC.8
MLVGRIPAQVQPAHRRINCPTCRAMAHVQDVAHVDAGMDYDIQLGRMIFWRYGKRAQRCPRGHRCRCVASLLAVSNANLVADAFKAALLL